MNAYTFTTQKDLRADFWATHPELDRRTVKDYSGKGRMHKTDARCAWCDYIDAQQKHGNISEALADRATL